MSNKVPPKKVSGHHVCTFLHGMMNLRWFSTEYAVRLSNCNSFVLFVLFHFQGWGGPTSSVFISLSTHSLHTWTLPLVFGFISCFQIGSLLINFLSSKQVNTPRQLPGLITHMSYLPYMYT